MHVIVRTKRNKINLICVSTLIQFTIVDLAGSISIVRLENIQPLVDVFEQFGKLLNIDRTGILSVEHRCNLMKKKKINVISKKIVYSRMYRYLVLSNDKVTIINTEHSVCHNGAYSQTNNWQHLSEKF